MNYPFGDPDRKRGRVFAEAEQERAATDDLAARMINQAGPQVEVLNLRIIAADANSLTLENGCRIIIHGNWRLTQSPFTGAAQAENQRQAQQSAQQPDPIREEGERRMSEAGNQLLTGDQIIPDQDTGDRIIPGPDTIEGELIAEDDGDISG